MAALQKHKERLTVSGNRFSVTLDLSLRPANGCGARSGHFKNL
jgi:hypothetical protein